MPMRRGHLVAQVVEVELPERAAARWGRVSAGRWMNGTTAARRSRPSASCATSSAASVADTEDGRHQGLGLVGPELLGRGGHHRAAEVDETDRCAAVTAGHVDRAGVTAGCGAVRRRQHQPVVVDLAVGDAGAVQPTQRRPDVRRHLRRPALASLGKGAPQRPQHQQHVAVDGGPGGDHPLR